MKLVGISGALIGAKPSIAVNEVLKAAKRIDPTLEVELIDMRDYNVEFVVGKPFNQYNEDTQTVVNKILEADLYVIGTPIYQASITGALKNLFDHLPTTALQSKVVGVVTTGGSDKHFLVADNQLKPILTFFKANTAASSVFVHSNDFNKENEIVNEEIIQRINNLAMELLFLQTKLFSN
ncbi:MAG: NADPH-dependent FMN reductase [Bacillus sp. (in: firmicutes)]